MGLLHHIIDDSSVFGLKKEDEDDLHDQQQGLLPVQLGDREFTTK